MTTPYTEEMFLIEARAGQHPHDYRCKRCGRLLFRAVFVPGTLIEIRCYKSQCRAMNVFRNVNGHNKESMQD